MGRGGYIGGSTIIRIKKRKRKKNKKRYPKIDQDEFRLLHWYIDKELNHIERNPNKYKVFKVNYLPKNVKGSLKETVKKNGGIDSWATKHHLYETLKNRKIQTYNKKISKKCNSSSNTTTILRRRKGEDAFKVTKKNMDNP